MPLEMVTWIVSVPIKVLDPWRRNAKAVPAK